MSSAEDEAELQDHGWILLTAGMEPYDRFRFIVVKILERALAETEPYLLDERIFEELEGADEDEIEAHLEALDEKLREDEGISDLERTFLCAAVGSHREGDGGEARCYEELLKLARCTDEIPLGFFDG